MSSSDFSTWTAALEAERRGRSVVIMSPLDPNTHPVFDYSGGALLIQLGMAHLDESLPNGQKERSELALLAIEKGVRDLRSFMEAKNFDI